MVQKEWQNWPEFNIQNGDQRNTLRIAAESRAYPFVEKHKKKRKIRSKTKASGDKVVKNNKFEKKQAQQTKTK